MRARRSATSDEISSRPCAPKLMSTLLRRRGLCAVSVVSSPNVTTGSWNDGSCASCRLSIDMRSLHWSVAIFCSRPSSVSVRW